MDGDAAMSVRPSAAELDEVLGQQFSVLDQGFVRVVDYMGTDDSIVQAARVSYGKGTKRVHEDRGLINYLLRNHHTTPFEMCEIKLHVRAPMDVWRQWIRHRTASVNEYSTRYSVAIDAAQRTAPDCWRMQSSSSKQGSMGVLPAQVGGRLSDEEAELHSVARRVYEGRLAAGVAREQARKDLPLSTYTEAYWKVDLHNLLHFLELRMDSHAQAEIRAYANVIAHEIVSRWCPLAWDAFRRYRLNGMTLSETEAEIIKAVSLKNAAQAIAIASGAGWVSVAGIPEKPNRERLECEHKLVRMGIAVPWHR